MSVERQIREEVEDKIRSGSWRPGYRIPFEHEFVASYHCSRATVSKALSALARAGMIQRRRRLGSFVADPPLHSTILDIPDLAALVAARGEVHRWSMIGEARRRQGAVAGGAVSTGTLHTVEGVHYAAERALAFEERLIDLGTVPEATGANFRAQAPGSWLLAHVAWSDARHRISAVGATRAQATALGIAPGTACLQVERWTWRAGRFVTYARQLFPGDRYDLVAEFNRGR